MSWEIRTACASDGIFHNLGKLDHTSAVVRECAPMGKW